MNTFLKMRINRASYWLMLVVGLGAVAAVGVLTGRRLPGELVLVLVCVPRLHDTGRSGWWVGAAILGEVVVIAAAFALLPLEGVPIALGIYGLLAIVWLIVLGIMPGESTANRFGKPTAPGLSFGRPAADPGEVFS